MPFRASSKLQEKRYDRVGRGVIRVIVKIVLLWMPCAFVLEDSRFFFLRSLEKRIFSTHKYNRFHCCMTDRTFHNTQIADEWEDCIYFFSDDCWDIKNYKHFSRKKLSLMQSGFSFFICSHFKNKIETHPDRYILFDKNLAVPTCHYKMLLLQTK